MKGVSTDFDKFSAHALRIDQIERPGIAGLDWGQKSLSVQHLTTARAGANEGEQQAKQTNDSGPRRPEVWGCKDDGVIHNDVIPRSMLDT